MIRTIISRLFPVKKSFTAVISLPGFPLMEAHAEAREAAEAAARLFLLTIS